MPATMPTQTPDPSPGSRDRILVEHPAFGIVELSKVSGSAVLFDSDFKHHGFITVRVRHGVQYRDLSHDWNHATGPAIVEFSMSHAQWAAFVGSFGMGGGVPCTLEQIDGLAVEEIAAPIDRRAQFKGEIADKLAQLLADLEKAQAALEAAGLSKARAKPIADALYRIRQEFEANIPWVQQVFGEHVESTIEAARVEINAHITRTIERAGLAHLTHLTELTQAPIALPGEVLTERAALAEAGGAKDGDEG